MVKNLTIKINGRNRFVRTHMCPVLIQQSHAYSSDCFHHCPKGAFGSPRSRNRIELRMVFAPALVEREIDAFHARSIFTSVVVYSKIGAAVDNSP